LNKSDKGETVTKQTEALKLALGKVQEFKCLWWKVPSQQGKQSYPRSNHQRTFTNL
jgi:hypothetical protein